MRKTGFIRGKTNISSINETNFLTINADSAPHIANNLP